MNNIDFVIADKRNSRSNNMQKFFKKKDNRRYCNVIRHDGHLWFADIYKDTDRQQYWKRPYDEWIGTRVVSVACFGAKASCGWFTSQYKIGFEDVTDWFWNLYREDGMIAIPEIWNKQRPKELKHAELHTI